MISNKESIIINRESCPVCNAKNFSILYKAKHDAPGFLDFIKFEKYYGDLFYNSYNNGPLKELEFNLAECNNCHFMFLTEVLNDSGMGMLYNEWLDPELLREHYRKLEYPVYQEIIVRLVKKYFRKKDKINVMDFGAGYGNFCSIATSLGLNTYAFDLSSDKNDHMNSMGVTIIGNFEKYQSHFDLIWVNQVLEHLSNPGEVLRNLQGCLKNDGIIYVAVPDCKNVKKILNTQGLSHNFFRFISPHQHVNAFNNSTLKLLGINAGLKPFSVFDFLKFFNTSLNMDELKLLTKRTIKNSAYGTGLFFKKSN